MSEIVELPPLMSSPANVLIAGGSQSGKSTVIRLLLKDHLLLFDEPIHKILYCYGQTIDDGLLEDNKNLIVTHKGLPTHDEIDNFVDQYNGEHLLLIIEDLWLEFVSDKNNYSFFVKFSHHKNTSCWIITHNLFQSSKISRLLTLSTHYIILTKNVRDPSSISHLGRQLFPGKANAFVKCYQTAMNKQLIPSLDIPPVFLINVHPLKSNKDYMLFSDFLPLTTPRIVYQIA
jgi:hypothetical protein